MPNCKTLPPQVLAPWKLVPTMACVQQPARARRFAVHSCRSDTASELQSLPCRPESFPVAAAEVQGVPEAAKRAGGRERHVKAFAFHISFSTSTATRPVHRIHPHGARPRLPLRGQLRQRARRPFVASPLGGEPPVGGFNQSQPERSRTECTWDRTTAAS